MNIALLSPSKSSYSETFIQVQKKGLQGRVFYYYDGTVPSKLEGEGSIVIKFGTVRKQLNWVDKDILSHSLKKSFKKHKINVVLAQYGPTGEAVADVCKALKIPLVVHFHGYDASIKAIIDKHHGYKNVFKTAHTVIVVSKAMKVQFIAMGCPEDKLVYNPCVPNAEFYDVQPNFSKPQFLAVGRFTDKKAPYLTLLAFKEVLLCHPNANLIMAGDGPLLNTCKNLAHYFNIGNQVRFPGVITPFQLQEYLSASLAFVQHSIIAENGDSEGTPVSILEAAAAGLPVISTYHAGIPDVIINGTTGLLCEEQDVHTMGQNMNQLLLDVDAAKKMGAAGKTHIKMHFSLETHLQTLQEILERAAASSPW